MKKLLSILLILAMLLPTAVFAENDEIKVFLDGEQVQFDAAPIIENNVTLVPMRAIFESLGATVRWGEEIQTVWAISDDYDVRIPIGSKTMALQRRYEPSTASDGEKSVELDAPARIVNGRTLVPLRAVSEAFDCDVQWDGDTKTVTITSAAQAVPSEPTYTEKFMSRLPQDENYVVSPFSLKMAMMLAANGAEGETQKEILDAFGVSDIKEFNANSKQLIADLNNDEKAEVNIANSIWFNKDEGGKNGDFSDTFKDIVRNDFSGNAETVTNKNSIEKVNEWTEKQTNGKIKNLLSEDNREYIAALVNAVYMKADWREPFMKEATRKEIFTDINGSESEIDFMHQTAHFDYYENEDTKIVRLPYTNDMSMYVVLGDTKNFDDNIGHMENKKVGLSLPKFKIEYGTPLNYILQSMGVNRAFEDNAQFSPMTVNTDEIKINTVLQKAFIAVDEKGTEAAAATAVTMDGAGMPAPEEIVEFKADKPFTYYITDDKYNEVLFAGRYVKPE